MSQISIKVFNGQMHCLCVSRGNDATNLVFTSAYGAGDRILFEFEEVPAFYWLQIDDAKGASLVYVTGNVEYIIPFGEKRINISPKVFHGDRHLITARRAYDFEIAAYRNLSRNVCDCHEATCCFPHASANIETRGESIFAALNAIDGVCVSSCHGEWPYESWGINRDPNAVFRLDFGRTVCTDRILLYTRADYPHDNWWKAGRIVFSDGSELDLELKKTGAAQQFTFDAKKIEWLELRDLIKSEEPSPFPALVQIEVYGTEVN